VPNNNKEQVSLHFPQFHATIHVSTQRYTSHALTEELITHTESIPSDNIPIKVTEDLTASIATRTRCNGHPQKIPEAQKYNHSVKEHKPTFPRHTTIINLTTKF
jgi:hypothetical protein